tara:strand:- start:200 stop:1096 length:897 start_codon:yes stop_codon:yes gene_type:complete
MKFSIIIPSFNNLNYLKLAINSIIKNSNYNHEIIIHVNDGSDGTTDFLKENKIKYSYSKENSGICSGLNLGSKLATTDYIVYGHDDFYFCPGWDEAIKEEIIRIGHNAFYLSGTMMHAGPIEMNCGSSYDKFDEKKLLQTFNEPFFNDFQGSTWAPHIIHKEYWEKVGGLSEEFNPGTGSDPDLNMKLWLNGVRIFKGISKSRVYHFGSIVSRGYKNHKHIKTETGRIGGRIFLLKWKITIKVFKKYYLKSDTKFKGPLTEPKKSMKFLLIMMGCQLYYWYIYLFKSKKLLEKIKINH